MAHTPSVRHEVSDCSTLSPKPFPQLCLAILPLPGPQHGPVFPFHQALSQVAQMKTSFLCWLRKGLVLSVAHTWNMLSSVIVAISVHAISPVS